MQNYFSTLTNFKISLVLIPQPLTTAPQGAEKLYTRGDVVMPKKNLIKAP